MGVINNATIPSQPPNAGTAKGGSEQRPDEPKSMTRPVSIPRPYELPELLAWAQAFLARDFCHLIDPARFSACVAIVRLLSTNGVESELRSPGLDEPAEPLPGHEPEHGGEGG